MKESYMPPLRCITIADLIRYRLKHDAPVRAVIAATLATRHGPARARLYRSAAAAGEHLALVFGDEDKNNIAAQTPLPVRLHAAGALRDTVGAGLCAQVSSRLKPQCSNICKMYVCGCTGTLQQRLLAGMTITRNP